MSPNRKERHHDATPIYVKQEQLSRTKRGYLDTLTAFSRRLLGHIDGKVMVPGVGGFLEPEHLSQVFGEHVYALDDNWPVIKHHKEYLRENRANIPERIHGAGSKEDKEEKAPFTFSEADHEILVNVDSRMLPFLPEVAKLVSFSSVWHEVTSDETRRFLSGKPSVFGSEADIYQDDGSGKFSTEKVARLQIKELQRVIQPGGILAIRDFLPQQAGFGKMEFKTEIAKLFFDAFYENHAKSFKTTKRYEMINQGDFGAVAGTYSDLSEVWMHFRWWWVDQIRRQSTLALKEDYFTSQNLKYDQEAIANLSKSISQDLVTGFDDFSPLQEYALTRLNVKQPLRDFREWAERYNIIDEYSDISGVIMSLFGNSNSNGRTENWYVCAYAPPDARDNHLLNDHFGLFNQFNEGEPIYPRRLMVFALRPMGGKFNSTDINRFNDMKMIADGILGINNRLHPSITEEEHFRSQYKVTS